MSDEREPEMRAKLEAGWDWMWTNCREGVEPHPECGPFEGRWFDLNREYTRRYDAAVEQMKAPPGDPESESKQSALEL